MWGITLTTRYVTGYIKYITDEEFKKIENYINGLQSPSMKMCLKLMIYLGLRAGEVVELKRENFNECFTHLSFKLKKRKNKNIKDRRLQEKLSLLLKEYYFWFRSHMREGYLFFPFKNQSKNSHIQRDAVTAKFNLMRKCLGIDDVYHVCKDGKKLYRLSSHTMRHYAIWRIYKATGDDIKAAQQIIGHIKMETTARYIYHIEAALKEKEIMEKAFEIN